MRYILLVLSILPIIANTADLLKFLSLPQYDRVSRVCQLTALDVSDYIAAHNSGLALIIKDTANLVDAVEQQLCRDNFAETAAQLLERRNVTVCELSVAGNAITDSSQQLIGSVGDIIVYYNGKRFVYYGRRDPSVLLSYILKLGSSAVKVITGKLDKVAFDLVAGPKLVGLFMTATPDLAAYETAAQKYSPAIPFYLVLDRAVGKHLKLTTVGQINLVKPYEKLSIPLQVNPATVADIDAFISANSGVVFKHLNEHNLYDPQLQNPNKTTFLAIGELSSAIGGYFHHLIVKAIRNITRENERLLNPKPIAQKPASLTAQPVVPPTPATPLITLDNVEILWVDPQVFPTIYVMMDQLERHYGFPPGLPVYFGAINATGNQSIWFNSALVNTTADKQADDTNILLLREWITSVINNTVKPLQAITNDGVQQFTLEPQDITVEPNGNFVLECTVQNQVGDCLWLHDGQNIGFNLARHTPHYSWRGDNQNGDCSLVVTGAVAHRDDGEWVCEVTGDQQRETLTSVPALVTVRSVPIVTAKVSGSPSQPKVKVNVEL